MQAIAEALQTDLAELLEGHADGSENKNIDIIMGQADHGEWKPAASVYSFKPPVHGYKNKHMSPFLFCVKKWESDVAAYDSEEFVYVLEGHVELNYQGRSYSIQQGDSFYLDAHLPADDARRQQAGGGGDSEARQSAHGAL